MRWSSTSTSTLQLCIVIIVITPLSLLQVVKQVCAIAGDVVTLDMLDAVNFLVETCRDIQKSQVGICGARWSYRSQVVALKIIAPDQLLPHRCTMSISDSGCEFKFSVPAWAHSSENLAVCQFDSRLFYISGSSLYLVEHTTINTNHETCLCFVNLNIRYDWNIWSLCSLSLHSKL